MNSQTTRVAIAAQSAKGTAATTGFHAMRLTRSKLVPVYEWDSPENEHTGVHQRASTLTGTPEAVSFTIPVALGGRLYPNAFGTLLRGLGFGVSSVDNTTYHTHTFTQADADAAAWLSAMQALGEDTARFERKVKDIRLTQLALTADRNGINWTADGLGLDEAIAAGTETVAAEANYQIRPSKGSLTFGALALGEPRSHMITIARPVEQDDQKLHAFGRAGADPTGFAVTGELRGLDLSLATYKKLNWGGASGTAPAQTTITGSLTVLWTSAANISGAAVPYSWQFAFTKAWFYTFNAEAQGNNIVRCDAQYGMIDDVAGAPLTITGVNGVTGY